MLRNPSKYYRLDPMCFNPIDRIIKNCSNHINLFVFSIKIRMSMVWEDTSMYTTKLSWKIVPRHVKEMLLEITPINDLCKSLEKLARLVVQKLEPTVAKTSCCKYT